MKKREPNFPLLKHSDFFQKGQYRKRGSERVTVEKIDKLSINQIIKTSINSDVRMPVCVLDMTRQDGTCFVAFLLETHYPSQIMRKTPDKFQSRDILQHI